MTEWRIELPWAKPPLNLNDRRHWAAHSQIVRDVRTVASWRARQARIGRHDRIRIELHYLPKTRRTRDEDNLVATLKPLVDGLRDAGVVPDDTKRYVERVWPVIHDPAPGRPGEMWLVITALAEVAS